MGETINVSYFVIGIYVAFVVGSSLLVGLLPAFVGLPTCEQSNSKLAPSIYEPDNAAPILNHYNEALSQVQRSNSREYAHEQRSKRFAAQEIQEKVKSKQGKKVAKKQPVLGLNQRIESYKRSHPEQVTAFNKHFKTDIKADYNICPEILNPEPNVAYPWYSPRLPTDVVPINYNIRLLIPQWYLNNYNGQVEITLDVVKATDTFLLNVDSDLEIPLLQSFVDANGKNITIKCVGEDILDDYFIFKTNEVVQPSQSPLKLNFNFISFFPETESGIFEIQFGKFPDNSTLLATKFEPLDARQAFPLFDEPQYKATYNFVIDHPSDTTVLFNTEKDGDIVDPGDYLTTTFQQTPRLPSYLIGFVAFRNGDFRDVEQTTSDGKIKIKLWAESKYIDEGYGVAPLKAAVKIFDSLRDLFRAVDQSALPSKIDIFAIPDYPIDAAPHFGLPIIRANRLLYKTDSASEKDKQQVALLLAKTLAEFWFGNFATFKWWDELWLQEALSDFIKYRAVEQAFPEYNIYEQFITEELINVLVDDAYPSSHPISKDVNSPYEIEEYFDVVERSKAAAILRMVEEYKDEGLILDALTAYLNAHPWGTADINVFYENLRNVGKWNAKDFFDRWTKQANYPLLYIEIIDNPDNSQVIKINQTRALNSASSIFSADLLYPSPYDFVWFVPVSCSFGTGPSNSDKFHEETFYLDSREFSQVINNPFNRTNANNKFRWVHCDRKFAGYYATEYTRNNWERLGQALRAGNNEFTASDRANIIHNVFVNSFASRQNYNIARDVISYLYIREKDYLPWKTLSKHLGDILRILDYKQSFRPVAEYFAFELKNIEELLQPWTPSGIHVEELLKETVIELACRLQDPIYLKKVSELWEVARPSLFNENFDNELLPPFTRETVFNYHLQNTYDVDEFYSLLREYETTNNLIQQRRSLDALTFPRLPWLLATLIDIQGRDELRLVNFFDTFKLLSSNPLGRELTWDYFRINYEQLLEKYGADDPRIGSLLVDITNSFENEFLFYELLDFIYYASEQDSASSNARFRSLEIVSTNVLWLADKETEIYEAFAFEETKKNMVKPIALKIMDDKNKKNKKEKIIRSLNDYARKFRESKATAKRS